MPGISSVTVYCGSANGSDPGYVDLARRLGKSIAKRGWRTVYGGGNVGLMGQLASSAHESGGAVLGVMPHFLRELEGVLHGIENRYTDNMHGGFLPDSFRQLMADTNSPDAALDALIERAIVLD
jgi:uncharacterized protein (TIGR00730 family)